MTLLQLSNTLCALSILCSLIIWRKNLQFIFAWYDLWIGAFYDQKKNWLYIFPIPMCGLIIKFSFPTTGKRIIKFTTVKDGVYFRPQIKKWWGWKDVSKTNDFDTLIEAEKEFTATIPKETIEIIYL